MASPTLSVEDILKYPELIPSEYARDQLDALDPVFWSQRHLTTEKGEPIEYKHRSYLKQYIRDFHPHLVVKKGAQIGVTTASIIKVLWISDQRSITSIYTFPTSTDVAQFSSLRFAPMVINSPYMMGRMTGVDNAGVKQIGKSTIYFRGTMTERQAISVPADILIHDELDFSRPDVKEIYGPRLSVSKYKFIWEFSTPTIPKFGIDAVFELSDKNFWMVRCSCGRWQMPDYFKNVMRRKKRRSGYYFGCKRCGKALNRNQGEWVTAYPKRTQGNKGIRGYWIPQSVCTAISADFLVAEHEKSKRSPRGERVFYNFNLGIAHESGLDLITRGVILDNISSMSDSQGHIFMGIDQGDLLHVEICKVIGERREVIYLEVTDKFSRIGELVKQFNPMRVVIDGNPNRHSAKEVRDAFPGVVFIADYNNAEGLWNPRNPDKEPFAININRLDALDNTAADWVSGKAVMTSNVSNKLIEQFALHMTNMKRDEVENKMGQNVAVWIKVGSDHFRHADLYAYIASQMPKFGSGHSVEVGGYIAPPNFAHTVFTENDVW